MISKIQLSLLFKLIFKQRQAIIKALNKCEADVEAIFRRLEELQLYDYILSPRDVVKVLNLSKSRISQIEQKALQKIKGGWKRVRR